MGVNNCGFYAYGKDPSEVMLSVSVDTEHDVDAYSYLHGICGVFALALADTFGYKIKFLRDSEEAGLVNLIHVFCMVEDGLTPPQYIDARGITCDKELFLGEFEDFFDQPIIEDVDRKELEAMMVYEMGQEGYPFFLDCAKKLIDRFPAYYRPRNLILSSDGKLIGEIKNLNSRPCPMEGCTGVRMHVKWPVGNSTYPCTKGCTQIGSRLWKIG